MSSNIIQFPKQRTFQQRMIDDLLQAGWTTTVGSNHRIYYNSSDGAISLLLIPAWNYFQNQSPQKGDAA